MDCYSKMYYTLFNRVTDALGFLDSGDMDNAARTLRSAQAECEEIFLAWEESPASFPFPVR